MIFLPNYNTNKHHWCGWYVFLPGNAKRLCYILRDMRWLPHISTCINTGVVNIYEVVLMIYFSFSYTKDGGPVCNINPFTKFWYSPISMNDSWDTHPFSYGVTANVLRHIGCAVIVCAKV